MKNILPPKLKQIYLILFLIIIFSFLIRVYKIELVPPSLSWDEAAVGYNAFTIANWGKDEYGKTFPLVFKSFGEDKQPIHIYTAAIFVKLLGPSEFSIRIASAVLGTLNVLMIFFLARILFKDNLIGLAASLFLSISPQNIFFSRFNHEANFALFFLMLGLYLFFKAVKEGRKNTLPLSVLSFIFGTISYHAAEIVIPSAVILLSFLYFKDLYTNKKELLISGLLLLGFIVFCVLNPRILGLERYNQTKQGSVQIERTGLFKQTHNYLLGQIELDFTQYLLHFSPKYLFESGDKNSRLSAQGSGEFYAVDALLLALGLLYLVTRRSREGLFVLFWALLGPLPSSLFTEAPHAGRAAFMMGSWHIIAAVGFLFLIRLLRKRYWKLITGVIFLIILAVSLVIYLNNYFNEFPKRYAIDWQYGMKQIVEYVQGHPEYTYVFMTSLRSQPYIFFLYYLKTPLPEYLNSVMYNSAEDKTSNAVSSYDRLYFSGWDPVIYVLNPEALYILTPSQYDGLIYKSRFNVKKVIYYPNNTTAYYVINMK